MGVVVGLAKCTYLVVCNKYKSHLLTAILIIMNTLPDGPIATLIYNTVMLQALVVCNKYKP